MPEANLEAHRERLEAFVADLVDPYLARMAVEDRRPSPRTKEFNDPVWGTVQVRAEEVFVLDSPLLQRLRRVRQLGVVHYVYPAATHTRLEHSLGTLHQVQRLITSINDAGLIREGGTAFAEDEPPVISGKLERVLRMAALCHDVGHGAMSHVSEYALSNERRSEDLQLAFQREMKSSARKQLSEIAAYYMIGSPAFARLADAAAGAAGLAPIDHAVQLIQKLIAGRRIDDTNVLLHELISGPFDADKLDYVTRDATMCGVPIVTDVPRLVQKVRATRVDSARLPPRIRQRVTAMRDGHLLTGIARSGGRSLDELALARALMFDKVYRHQKVRAVESMMFSLIERLAPLSDLHPAELILHMADDEFLALDEQKLRVLVGHEPDPDETDRIAVVADLSRRVRERDLFVRGFAFAAVMTGDAYRTDPAHVTGLSSFLSDCRQPTASSAFVQKVVSYVTEIAAQLGKPGLLNVPGGDLKPYILLSPPKPAPKTGNVDTGHAHLIDNDGEITQFQDDAAETMPWADAYIATRDLGHIFCPEPLAPLVFIAAEAALREAYEVHTPPSMLLYAKQRRDQIEQLKTALHAAGWYEGKPSDLKPLPHVLTLADADQRVDAIVERLAGYSGPTQAGLAGSSDQPASTVQREQVLGYVQQFPDDDLVNAAIEMLSNIRVIGRQEMNTALDRFLSNNPEFSDANCSNLGEEKDSSSVVTYYVGDTVAARGLRLSPLSDALVADQPIVFVDDFIGTGNQLVDVIESWLGEERSSDLGEDRGALSESSANLLRAKKLAFVFAAGTVAGVERARARLAELGLDASVYAHITDDDLPTIEDLELDPDVRTRLRGYLTEVAERALEGYGGKERSAEWIAARTRGYGNREFLLTSTFNTPTAAVTALWIEKPDVWRPLLRRRRKE